MTNVKWMLVWFASWFLLIAARERVQHYYGNILTGSDAQYYYALATSIVYDGDTDITNDLLMTPYPKPFDDDLDGYFERAHWYGDRIVSRYPIGVSLIEALPLSVTSLAVKIASYLWPGVQILGRFDPIVLRVVGAFLNALHAAGIVAVLYYLVEYKKCSPLAAVFFTFAATVGTNLFYYLVVTPGCWMGHGIAFVGLIAVLYSAHAAYRQPRVLRLLALGTSLGALFLVRPQQVVILLPIAAGLIWSATQHSRRIKERLFWALALLMPLAIAATIHLGFIYSQFGVLHVSGYALHGEGFRWPPKLGIVLWSRARGLFVYSPLWLIPLLGALIWPKVILQHAVHWINVVAQVGIIACWSSPEQGESFGSRMLSENSYLVAICLGTLWQQLSTVQKPSVSMWGRIAASVLICACVAWTFWFLGAAIGLISHPMKEYIL